MREWSLMLSHGQCGDQGMIELGDLKTGERVSARSWEALLLTADGLLIQIKLLFLSLGHDIGLTPH